MLLSKTFYFAFHLFMWLTKLNCTSKVKGWPGHIVFHVESTRELRYEFGGLWSAQILAH